MRSGLRLIRSLAVISVIFVFLSPRSWSEDATWVELTSLDAWKAPVEGWTTVGSVGLDPKNPKLLVAEPGVGVIYNGPTGRARNLISRESFGDVEIHLEFMIPKGSNSGIKFQAVYEVQIFDSFGAKKLKGSDCGGVYPRSEEKPKYHHIDDGHPPLVNASKAPGEWQTLDLVFLAPRIDADGKKTASARITAKLNGQVVQDNLEATTPTGAAWHDREKATGPILLQADHGPVAFRNVRARSLSKSP